MSKAANKIFPKCLFLANWAYSVLRGDFPIMGNAGSDAIDTRQLTAPDSLPAVGWKQQDGCRSAGHQVEQTVRGKGRSFGPAHDDHPLPGVAPAIAGYG
jgi:hypothetical protein